MKINNQSINHSMDDLYQEAPEHKDNTYVVKIVFCVFIFIDSVFFGILPSKWQKIRNSQTILSLLNAFSAGVFIAIAFNHILPEAVEHYEEVCTGRCFPWPYFIVFCGYSMILLLDKVAFDSTQLFDTEHGQMDPAAERLQEISRKSILRQEEAYRTGDQKAIRKSMVQNQEELREGLKSYMNKYDSIGVRMSAATKRQRNTITSGELDPQTAFFVEGSKNDLGVRSKHISVQQISDQSSLKEQDQKQKHLLQGMEEIKEDVKQENCQDCDNLPKGLTKEQKEKSHLMHKEILQNKNKRRRLCGDCNMTPFILMIALSVHALFEGIAVGIEPQLASVWSLIIGILIHKSAASVSLGISLQKSFPDDLKIPLRMSIGFAIASPLGIIIGMFLRDTSPMVNVVFSSIAAGTFVYIACSEVIVEEFSLPGNRFLKYFVFVIGALIITSLWFLDTD